MFNLTQWAIRYGVSAVALADLKSMLHGEIESPPNIDTNDGSESWVQSAVRLEASNNGVWLLRNNVGACQDKSGRLIRYGLANDSKQMNERIKSSDLIGIRPVIITVDMVGSTIGQFTSREIKPAGWNYSGTKHEQAQLRWISKVVSMGGDACFASGVGTI